MSFYLEKALEEAIISELESNAYIDEHEIPAFTPEDATQDRVPAAVTVAAAAEKITGLQAFKVDVSITAITLVPEDRSGAVSKELYAQISNFIGTLTNQTVREAFNEEYEIDVDGVLPMPPEMHRTGESLISKTAKAEFYVSYEYTT